MKFKWKKALFKGAKLMGATNIGAAGITEGSCYADQPELMGVISALTFLFGAAKNWLKHRKN